MIKNLTNRKGYENNIIDDFLEAVNRIDNIVYEKSHYVVMAPYILMKNVPTIITPTHK